MRTIISSALNTNIIHLAFVVGVYVVQHKTNTILSHFLFLSLFSYLYFPTITRFFLLDFTSWSGFVLCFYADPCYINFYMILTCSVSYARSLSICLSLSLSHSVFLYSHFTECSSFYSS